MRHVIVQCDCKPADPVGQMDIATRLGYPSGTVAKWLQRGVFDLPPKWTVSGSPVWEWQDVQAWAERTNRAERMNGVQRV